MDLVGIEPTTSSMPWKRAPSCATGPLTFNSFSLTKPAFVNVCKNAVLKPIAARLELPQSIPLHMSKMKKEGLGAVFVAASLVFGLAILIGLFYWMIHKPNPVPHSPARPNGTVWVSPAPSPATRVIRL